MNQFPPRSQSIPLRETAMMEPTMQSLSACWAEGPVWHCDCVEMAVANTGAPGANLIGNKLERGCQGQV
jgi:hypothetical protein